MTIFDFVFTLPLADVPYFGRWWGIVLNEDVLWETKKGWERGEMDLWRFRPTLKGWVLIGCGFLFLLGKDVKKVTDTNDAEAKRKGKENTEKKNE